MTSRARRAVVALLSAVVLLSPAVTASAHDQLVGSEPEDGASGQAPDEIVLTFSGAIGDLGAQMAVTDGAGTSVVDGEIEVDGEEVTQDLVDDLSPGDYRVVWRVTSEDGHPISGQFAFTVEGDTTTTDTTTDTASGAATDDSTGTAPEQTDADVTADADPTDGAAGLPVWAWVLVVLGAAGLLGLLARTWARGRE